MSEDAFTAGVRPGSPVTYTQIKILIMHTLAASQTPVPFDALHEALRENELVNYFSLVEGLDQLCETGHLEVTETDSGGQAYLCTKLGSSLAAELSSSLPPATRERAAAAIQSALKRRRRLGEVKIDEVKRDNGYELTLSIPDIDGELLSVCIFAPTTEDRGRIRRRFLNDPVYLYKCILALLTGDIKELDIPKDEDELFN